MTEFGLNYTAGTSRQFHTILLILVPALEVITFFLLLQNKRNAFVPVDASTQILRECLEAMLRI